MFSWDPQNRFVGSVGVILAVQGGPDPIHLYREVNDRQASRIPGRRGTEQEWVNPIARNSVSRGRSAGSRALVLLDRPLEPLQLGNSQGHVSDGTPILVNRAYVRLASADRLVPEAVLLAQVVTHEAGHKFSLDHYWRQTGNGANLRQLNYVPRPTNLGDLQPSQFSLEEDPSDRVYVRLQAYQDAMRGIEEVADDPFMLMGGARVPVRRINRVHEDALGRVHVYELRLRRRIPSINPSSGRAPLFQVQAGIGRMMDWSPRSTLRAAGDWMFLESDLVGLCLLDGGCSR